jgi:hypothetical protein
MSHEPKTPVTISVAKWTTIAAAVTAFGSMFQTMWTDKPWWLQNGTEVRAESKATHEKAIKKADHNFEAREKVSLADEPAASTASAMMAEEPTNVMATAPDFGFWFKVRHPSLWSFWTWVMVSSLTVMMVTKVAEIKLRNRHKKLLESQPPFTR